MIIRTALGRAVRFTVAKLSDARWTTGDGRELLRGFLAAALVYVVGHVVL